MSRPKLKMHAARNANGALFSEKMMRLKNSLILFMLPVIIPSTQIPASDLICRLILSKSHCAAEASNWLSPCL